RIDANLESFFHELFFSESLGYRLTSLFPSSPPYLLVHFYPVNCSGSALLFLNSNHNKCAYVISLPSRPWIPGIISLRFLREGAVASEIHACDLGFSRDSDGKQSL